ncbi:MAG TPA: ABC transporter substrate-binding protein [Kiloniellales bacterium]
MTRSFMGLRSVIAGAALIAAAASWAVEAAADIKIGSVLAVTGRASFLGDPEDKTLKMYVDQINAAGGLLGQKIQLIVYDSAGDAEKARTFATRLIEEDGIIAMVGGSSTGETMAMLPLFEEAKIPFISLAGGIVIIEPVKPYVFKTPHTDRMACQKIYADMTARGISKIGLISGSGGFEKSMRAECMNVAKASGIEILADETYGPQDNDMTPQLTNIRNTAGIQAVLNPGFGQGPAIVTANYKQLGITVPLYQSHGVASRKYIELAGDASEGVRLPASALLIAENLPDDDPQKPVVVSYKQAFETKWNEPVSTFGGHAYDGLFILVEAIKRANSLEPSKIRDEIENTKGFMGTAGLVNMSPSDHLGLDLTAFRMLEIIKGDWTLVK